mgnify:CR=1
DYGEARQVEDGTTYETMNTTDVPTSEHHFSGDADNATGHVVESEPYTSNVVHEDEYNNHENVVDYATNDEAHEGYGQEDY